MARGCVLLKQRVRPALVFVASLRNRWRVIIVARAYVLLKQRARRASRPRPFSVGKKAAAYGSRQNLFETYGSVTPPSRFWLERLC
jgi:hypothetical protein